MKFVGKVSSLGVGRVRKEEPRVPQGYGAYGTCVPMSQASVQSMRRLSCEDAASLGSVSGYPEGGPNPVSEHADGGILLFLPCLVNARFWCNSSKDYAGALPRMRQFPLRSAR